MKELTKDMISNYKDEYVHKKDIDKLSEKYKTMSISDLAFREEKAKQQEFSFSIEVPTMSAISQGFAGRCWIFAGLNLLREEAAKHMELSNEEFCFSTSYLCFWDKLEKANCFLEKAIEKRKESYNKREVYSWFQYAVTDGGFWTCFTDLVAKYGLVPEEVMPDTIQSANTEEMNNRLNYYLRKVCSDIRNAASEDDNMEDIRRIKDQAMERIYNFLCLCYGCPPEQFEYQYKCKNEMIPQGNYTPLTFYHELLGDYMNQFTNVISLPYEKLPFGEPCILEDVFQVIGMHEEMFLNLTMEDLKQYCIQQLKDGVPVVCVADDDKMCREELQLWDDQSFDYEETTGFSFDMSRKDYFQLKAGIACHSMMITGVNLGAEGKPNRWKIENSYGVDGLHKGYYTCSDSWFEKYMVSAVIHKQYIKEDWKSKQANPFQIWDIM